ncbi:MAG: adenylate/guanylate cyclase domain-containing protein [Polyangiaceae bacterium]
MVACVVAALVAARAVVRPVLALRDKARVIGRRAFAEVRAPSPRRDEIGELDRAIVQMATDIESQEESLAREAKLRGDLGRFMSQELVDSIVRREHPLELGGERRTISVLFADVVAFTPLAETRKPEQVVALLNELFTILTEVVFRHGGVVDKFLGDSIMAMWGAPVAHADHAARALAAAEDMIRFLDAATVEWSSKYDVELRIGIGVNSGEAIVGNVGSNKRMEYTAIGDTVNIAARLESIARPNQVLVGEATHRLAGDRASGLRRLGAQVLSGRKTETVVYELEV